MPDPDDLRRRVERVRQVQNPPDPPTPPEQAEEPTEEVRRLEEAVREQDLDLGPPRP